MAACWRILFIGGLLGFAMVVGVALLPMPTDFRHVSYAKLLLGQNDRILAAHIADDHQWRFPATERLPAKYMTAVLQFEDRFFYQHFGINPIALGRSFVGNLRAGKVVSGGSTITMQLARLLRGDPPRTYKNKFLEIILACKLEWLYSKDQILALYASHAPFGGNTVGLSAATWRYFGKQWVASEAASSSADSAEKIVLSWADAALLAVLPNSPGLIHPGRSRPKLLQKRNRLLKRLHQRGLLTAMDLRISLLEPLPEKPKAIPRIAPHLMHTMASQLPSANVFRTTVVPELQLALQRLAESHAERLDRRGVRNLSLVVLDNRNMSLQAYLGNVTSSQSAPEVDITVKPRSTGSILKPLLYGVMLQQGELLPNTLIPDIPSDFRGYTPENFDRQYRGVVPANQALAQSLNVPAVHMLKQYGVARFYDDLQQLGISTLFRPPDDYGLSLILGGAEGTLWEITRVYAGLVQTARRGFYHPLISPGPGWTGSEASPMASKESRTGVLGQGAAWLTLDALVAVSRPAEEQYWRQFSSSQTIAWKTGTSYGLRDAWAIGSNGRYTVGVWAGNASGEGVAGLSGLKSAAPLLFDTFDHLGDAQWLETPEWALKSVTSCQEDGFLPIHNCPTQQVRAPKDAHFQRVSPYYKQITVTSDGLYRVHGGCEKARQSHTISQLFLPPTEDYYWRLWRSHKHRQIPPWRADCLQDLANYSSDVPLEVVYPQEGARVYIPRELDGQRGRVVFTATHRQPKTALFWHIDDEFVGKTTHFHQQALNITAGWHQLILVDEQGFRVERWFRVLAEEGASDSLAQSASAM